MPKESFERTTYKDVNDIEWEVFETPSFQFRMAHVQIRMRSEDNGPMLVVTGRRNGEWCELLKFDCYQSKMAHWHRCHPEGVDQIDLIYGPGKIGTYTQAIDFSMNKLREMGRLVAEQGFPELNQPDRIAEVAPVLPAVERRMRELGNDDIPRQVLTRVSQPELDRIMPAMNGMVKKYGLAPVGPAD